MYNTNNNNQAGIIDYPINSRRSGFRNSQLLPILDPDREDEFDKIISINEIEGHIGIHAKTRSGKTELTKTIFVRLARKTDGSIVILDPHGDFSLECAKMMNDKKDIILIDPTLKKGFTPTINPFRLKKIDEVKIAIVAQELISAFESIIGEDFSNNMEVVLTPIVYVLLRKGNSGIDEILIFLNDENNQSLIALGLQSPIKEHREFFRTQFSKGKFTKTKEALATKIQLLLSNPNFANFITGESTFNLEKALNNKRIVIFRFSKGAMRKTLEPALKLIMALIQGIVFRRANLPMDARPKTYLLCDEYQNFSSQISNDMLSESAKNKLFILAAHQHLSQLDTKCKDALISASHIIAVGQNSKKDLKTMAEEIEVKLESLQSLQQGEFYIKTGTNPAIKIVTTDKYLGNKYSISHEQWIKHLKYQIKHYYRKLNDDTIEVETTSETKNDNSSKAPMLPIPSSFDETL